LNESGLAENEIALASRCCSMAL
jgi:hypothetical protein